MVETGKEQRKNSTMTLLYQERFDFAYCVRMQQRVTAYCANVSRHVVDDNHLLLAPHGMNDNSRFVLSRTAFNAALHFPCLRCYGVTHYVHGCHWSKPITCRIAPGAPRRA